MGDGLDGAGAFDLVRDGDLQQAPVGGLDLRERADVVRTRQRDQRIGIAGRGGRAGGLDGRADGIPIERAGVSETDPPAVDHAHASAGAARGLVRIDLAVLDLDRKLAAFFVIEVPLGCARARERALQRPYGTLAQPVFAHPASLARRSISAAWARALAVTSRPAIMRAISRSRAAASRRSTACTVRPSRSRLWTRR